MPTASRSVPTWRRRTTIGLAAIATLVIVSSVALLAFLASVDLGRYPRQVEGLLSRALGVEIKTSELHLHLDLDGTAAVDARGVTLRNPGAPVHQELLNVDRLRGRIGLWPLLSRRVVVHELAVCDAGLTVAIDERGASNWARRGTDAGRAKHGSGRERRLPRIEVGRAVIERLTTTVETPAMDRPLVILAHRLELATRTDDMVVLDYDGAVAGRPLSVRGHLGPTDQLLVARAVRGHLVVANRGARATVRGSVGDLRTLGRPELEIEAVIPRLEDLSPWLETTGPLASSGPVAARCTFEPSGSGVRVEVEASAAQLTARAHGEVDALSSPRRCDLEIRAEGDDLAAVGAGLGIPGLPAEQFTVAGGVGWSGFPIVLRAIELEVGAHRIVVDGAVGGPPALAGTDLLVSARGPSLVPFRQLAHLELPDEPYEAEADLSAEGAAVRVRESRLRIADSELEASGWIATVQPPVGIALDLALRGRDLSSLAWLAPGARLPAGPFDVTGAVEIEPEAVVLRGVRGVAAEATFAGDGRIGLRDRLDGTRLAATARGPDASLPLSLLGLPGGHGLGFSFSGAVRLEDGGIVLEDVDAAVGELHGTANGRVGLDRPTTDLDLEGGLEGPRLVDLEPFGAPPGLPALPFRFVGRLQGQEGCLGFEDVIATFGAGHRLALDGWLATAPGLVGSDLRALASGPDLGELGRSSAGILDLPALPSAPYAAFLDAASGDDGVELRMLSASLGPAAAVVAGRAGSRPGLDGTAVEVRVETADLAELGSLLGHEGLPARPATVAGRLSWLDRRLVVNDLSASLGVSDVSGSVELTVRERSALRLRLDSETLDVSDVWRTGTEPADTAEESAPSGSSQALRYFSDEPLAVSSPSRFDGDAVWRIETLRVAGMTVTDVELAAELDHDGLRLGPVAGRGAHGGTIRGDLAVRTSPAGVAVHAVAAVEGAHADLARGPSPAGERLTTVDATVELDAAGATPRQLAVGASGRVAVTLTDGAVNRSIADRLGAGLVRSVLTTLNPFVGRDASPVELECAVLLATFSESRMVLDPMVVKTENLTLVGNGAVDLATEALEAEWVMKPRQGIGLSASAITNSYVKLSGTLAQPSIGVKTAEALATTGVAIATGGLSILGKGLYDRLTADRDVCAEAFEKVQSVASGAGSTETR